MDRKSVFAELRRIVRTKFKKFEMTDDELNMKLEEVEQAILNYCMIPCVPYQLRFIWANMTIDLLNYEFERNRNPEDIDDGIDPGDISTIKLGDTTVTLGDKYRSNQRSQILQGHVASLDDITMNYQDQLNRFRKLW